MEDNKGIEIAPWKKLNEREPISISLPHWEGKKQVANIVTLDPNAYDVDKAEKAARIHLSLPDVKSLKGKTQEEVQKSLDDKGISFLDLNMLTFACSIAACVVGGLPVDGKTLGEQGETVLKYISHKQTMELFNALRDEEFFSFF
jgi:hypothetical protein